MAGRGCRWGYWPSKGRGVEPAWRGEGCGLFAARSSSTVNPAVQRRRDRLFVDPSGQLFQGTRGSGTIGAVPNPPDPAVLYPDVAACGCLAAALRAEAEGCLGAVAVRSSGLVHAVVSSTVPHREPLEISAWSWERRWSIRGTAPFQRLPLIDGTTDDLAEIARAARAWHDGTALDDIRRAAPFVHLTGRLEVPDRDPARLTESEWKSLRLEAAEMEYDWHETYQALIEAAYAESALRALYPFTSHWALRFSTTTRPDLTVVGQYLASKSGHVRSGQRHHQPGPGRLRHGQGGCGARRAPSASRSGSRRARRMNLPSA